MIRSILLAIAIVLLSSSAFAQAAPSANPVNRLTPTWNLANDGTRSCGAVDGTCFWYTTEVGGTRGESMVFDSDCHITITVIGDVASTAANATEITVYRVAYIPGDANASTITSSVLTDGQSASFFAGYFFLDTTTAPTSGTGAAMVNFGRCG